ncbi:MAG: type II toxin-antitoxin system PemK/MazF family toxin [Phycisphaerae bacterium]|nr:type II toxin-antitoxin system PemK/MazF family toxin [Phycisphaerae bacterium]
MVAPSIGSVVLVRFPFSDLSESKLRPAVVLADAGRGDWVLCQVTSNPYSDSRAVEILDSDFASGTLARISYARPGKLFTANTLLMQRAVGELSSEKMAIVLNAVVTLFSGNNLHEI